MGKHRRIAFILAFIALLGGTVWLILGRGEPEPVYQGKTLSQWLEHYNTTSTQRTPAQSHETLLAFRAMGTNTIPHLLRILAANDSAQKLKLVALAQKQSLIKINFVPASTRRTWVAKAFSALGAQGRPAVPGLVDIYEHSPDLNTRMIAATILGDIGRDAREAVPALIHTSTNTNVPAVLRNISIRTLISMHADPALVVPALIQILKEPSAELRINAVMAISDIGPDAKPAIPALFDVLKAQGKDQQAISKFKAQKWNLISVNAMICSAIEAIDPETAVARKSEIDAALSAGKQQ